MPNRCSAATQPLFCVVALCAAATAAGEGLVSLTRGFQYAGAASVFATLWDVEDRATATWMATGYVPQGEWR